MLYIKMDVSGEFEVRLPKSADEVIALATRYVAYESHLPADERLLLPALPLVQAQLAQAQAVMESAIRGEADRAAAAEQLRQGLAHAHALLNVAVLSLRARYVSNLAQLEHWGMQTRMAARGVAVTKPVNSRGLIAFMEQYLAREQSLAAAERISEPPLESVLAVAETIGQNLRRRRDSTTQRTINIEARTVAVAQLLEFLELAVHALLVTRYRGRVTTALEVWGFRVDARTRRSATSPAESVAESVVGEQDL